MRIQTVEPTAIPCTSSWSNRFLIAAIVGILFLTLFPFRFDIPSRLPGNSSPFLLGNGMKTSGVFDAFLNVLLFIPLGFGFAEKLREHGMSRTATFFFVWTTAAIFSYAIEITQIYIPMRDSGWEDVITNSSGALVGFFIYELAGTLIIDFLSRCQILLRSWLTLRRTVVLLPIYFLSWFAISALLQKQTRLSNWEPECLLIVGNDGSGQDPWQGRVQKLQIADQAIPHAAAIHVTSGRAPQEAPFVWRADYDFSRPAPFQDSKEFLPSLSWTPTVPLSQNSNELSLGGKSWLTSRVALAGLVDGIRKTNQFSLHILCSVARPRSGTGHIITIAGSPGLADLTLRQEESSLVFWFRSPVSAKRAMLAWYAPNVFTDTEARDIVYAYDGADLSLYINGKKIERPYRLSAGTGLARLLRRVRPAELEGYNDIYYSLVFLPAGMILGITTIRQVFLSRGIRLAVALNCLLPVFLLEFILVWVSGRPVSCWNLFLSFLLFVAGFFWIRSDSIPSSYRNHSPFLR
jgi:glycopeptide antibiotics resistance protein